MSEADEIWSKLRESDRIVLRHVTRDPSDVGIILRAIACLARRLPEDEVRGQIARAAHVGIALAVLDHSTDEDGS